LFSRDAPPVALPRLTRALLAEARAPLPWWLPHDAPALPPDLGASEDTALRQVCGVVGADKGTARAVLVVGSGARPVGAGAAGARLLALLRGAATAPQRNGSSSSSSSSSSGGGDDVLGVGLAGRSDWDVVVLGALHPVPPPPEGGAAARLLRLGERSVIVHRPAGFPSGLLQLHFPRPPPPPPLRTSANDTGAVHVDELLGRWRASYFPSTVCPPPLAAAGPHPAYLLRPSLHFLRQLNSIRQLSTLTVDTLAHPGAGARRPPAPPPPRSAAAAAAAMDVSYADATEPYGLLPWLCAWPTLTVLLADSPLVDAARAGWAAWAEGEAEAGEVLAGGGAGAAEVDGGPGLAPALAALVDAAPPPRTPGAVRALRCARSLLPATCAAEAEWVPPESHK
jgi:hypothetical protein